jgi:hypothetical protein
LPISTEAVILINGNPIIMYLRFLEIEKTLLPKKRFTPVTKNKEQIRYEAIPNPL